MRQTGHSLEKVHGQRKGAPATFTSCGRRGVTTSKVTAITCKRCLARREWQVSDTFVPRLPPW